ncbi:hypothetical protein [Roseivirga echinicomitans]|uniref:DUF4221 domain-containing protein n=1 Tax=Roseivirga echinicomitans TaxID=296218 RepID=A0A150XUW7_9BACT|nr:hypothetical protein [Roseivirga echinicomitans]KYG82547.1 hypothetical protein AWN68_14955 [Roseivirga echinicomitans]
MKKYSLYFLLVSAFGLLISCGSSNETTTNVASIYKLQIVDSVQVNLLSSGLSIADVNDETGELLAIQPNPPVAYVLSPKGEVLKKMGRQAGDPQAVGDYLLSGEFYEDGIALMGFMTVKTYDMDFNLRESMKPDFTHGGMVYMGFNHLFEIKGNDHNRLVAYMGPQTEFSDKNEEYYQDRKIMTLIDPYLAKEQSLATENMDKEIYKPVGKLASDSRFVTSGKAFYFLKPELDVKDNFLYYAFKGDTTMYKVELPSGEIVGQMRIPFDKFILFKGFSMGPVGLKEQRESRPSDKSGSIERVYKLGDFEVIVYSSGMKLSDIEALDRDSPDFRERLMKADPQKHLIIKNGRRMNDELRLPDKVSHFDMADNEGFLWAHQDISELEEEPDLITFYKLKVVEVK